MARHYEIIIRDQENKGGIMTMGQGDKRRADAPRFLGEGAGQDPHHTLHHSSEFNIS